jgi:Nuclease-related domain
MGVTDQSDGEQPEQPGPPEPPEPTDLAGTVPGLGLTHEAARRRQREGAGADLSWRRGADGEFAVGELLDQLCAPAGRGWRRGRPSDWRVLHGAMFVDEQGRDRGDVDHLLVGPPGVVTINTKHHPAGKVVCDGDRITVNRRDQPYVPKARREAERVRDLLGPALTAAGHADLAARLIISPMIALVGATLQIRRPAPGVMVFRHSELLQRLRSMSKRLDVGEIDAIYQVVSLRSTWRSRPSG